MGVWIIGLVFDGAVVVDAYISALFFFFKQKTAYEMRISDWSSDVCSSDLRADEQPAVRAALDRELVTRGDTLRDQMLRRGQEVVEAVLLVGEAAAVVPFLAVFAAAADVRDRKQIGRASGRERVCQYV